MEYLYDTALDYHKFFALLVFVMSVIHLFLTQFGSGEGYVKRIRLFLPAYYATLAMLCVTGAVILPIFDFKMSFSVVFMMIAFIVMIGLGAMGYKRLKMAWVSKNLEIYKKDMRVILAVNLALILLASFI